MSLRPVCGVFCLGVASVSQWRNTERNSLFPRSAYRGASSSKRRAGYTLLFIPEESGTPIRVGFPRWALVVALLLFFGVSGGVSAMVVDYMKVQHIVRDYERLRAENHSIRSEAAAIISRLENVQSALNKVDSISNEIREISKPEAPGKGIKGRKGPALPRSEQKKTPGDRGTRQGSLGGNADIVLAANSPIGPIPREDYMLAKALGRKRSELDPTVNFEKLEFKEIFEQLLSIGSQSESKSRELERLLREVRDYQARISHTPTMSPMQGYVSSLFGVRESPISGNDQMHSGLDIAAPVGTPVFVAAAGTIISVRRVDDYGKVVDVDHGNGIRTRYAHLSAFELPVGSVVNKGDLIARSGDTGRSTGPHLHYEVEVNGRKVNPVQYIHDWQ